MEKAKRITPTTLKPDNVTMYEFISMQLFSQIDECHNHYSKIIREIFEYLYDALPEYHNRIDRLKSKYLED